MLLVLASGSATHFNIMSQKFTVFVNFCITANSGTGSFDNIKDWLLSNSRNEDLLLSEGPIDFLLKFKAPIDILKTLLRLQPSITFIKFSEGRMALHLAACSSVTVEVMELILEHNTAALLTKDSMGNSPLHCAVKYHAPVPVITYLVNCNPPGRHRNQMLATNKSGQTPLHIACSNNPMVILFTSPRFYDIEVIKVKDKKGNLPLHLACFNSNSRSDLVNKLIILYPEALQIPNDEGNLPLHMACAGKAKEELLKAI